MNLKLSNTSFSRSTKWLALSAAIALFTACSNGSTATPFTSPADPQRKAETHPTAKIDPYMIQGKAMSLRTFQVEFDKLREQELKGTSLQLQTLEFGEFRFTEEGKWAFIGNSVELQVNKSDCQISTIDLDVVKTQNNYKRFLKLGMSLPYWIEGVTKSPKLITFTMPAHYTTDHAALGRGTSAVVLQPEPALRLATDVTVPQVDGLRTVYFEIKNWNVDEKSITILAKFYTARGTIDVAVLNYGPSGCRP